MYYRGKLPQLDRVWNQALFTLLHHGTCASVAKAIANVAAVFTANHNGFCNGLSHDPNHLIVGDLV